MWVCEGHPTSAVVLGAGREFSQPGKLILQPAAAQPIVVALQLSERGLQLGHLDASRAAGELLQHRLVDKDVLLLERGNKGRGREKTSQSK